MANVTLYIPDDLKKRMASQKGTNWSSAIRTIIERKLDAFEEAEELAKASTLTDEDVAKLTKKVNKAAAKHARELLNAINR
ncbi:MAG: hypothetical protein AABY04_03465 [Candidatus Micrarchaeota archaeon]